jgi:hypothetical protein
LVGVTYREKAIDWLDNLAGVRHQRRDGKAGATSQSRRHADRRKSAAEFNHVVRPRVFVNANVDRRTSDFKIDLSFDKALADDKGADCLRKLGSPTMQRHKRVRRPIARKELATFTTSHRAKRANSLDPDLFTLVVN